MRVVYFGMLGAFSRAPLAALLNAGIDVRGVVIPARGAAALSPGPSPVEDRRGERALARIAPEPPRSQAPVAGPYLGPNIVHIAWQRGIPVFEARHLDHPDTLAAIAGLRPDVACVACFSKRIPVALLALPEHGFLNVHPSLLPAYRGPEPLFWAFRNGEASNGVTVHFMDEGLDTGGLVAQARIEFPDGVSGAEAERLCAESGGRLLVDVIRALHLTTDGAERNLGRPQPEGGSYYPAPAPGDFALSLDWPARRAFNFMRGTAEWNRPYTVEVNGERLALQKALSYSATQTLDQSPAVIGDEAWIQFSSGVLRARALRIEA